MAALGHAEANVLVPMVFLVIITTVILQSLTAGPLARWLNVQELESNGFLIIGANQVARIIGKAVLNKGVPVLITDTSWENIRLARMENLPVYYGKNITFARLVSQGATVRSTQLSPTFTLDDYRIQHGNRLNILFTLPEEGKIVPKISGRPIKAIIEGTEIISLIQPEPENIA